jgi:hypothetical protein
MVVSHFENLESLSICECYNIISVSNYINLKHLQIHGCHDFTDFRGLANLNLITFEYCKSLHLRNLDFLEHMSRLTSLRLCDLPRLNRIDGLMHLDALEILVFIDVGTNRIPINYTPIVNLEKLKQLSIYGKYLNHDSMSRVREFVSSKNITYDEKIYRYNFY